MKQILLFFLAIFSTASMCLNAQTDAVDLKDGAGTVLGSYNSVTAAYAAIPATLSNAYVIEMKASYNGSNETYPISFTAKAGADDVNTITVRPAAGVTSLSITTSVTPTTSAVFILNDADYVIIDGRPGGAGTTKALTIGNTATNSNTIQLINGACFNKIRYCILQNNSVGSAGRALHLSTSASNTTGNSDNNFEFLTVVGSRYGINSGGTAANPNTRNRFFGCEFTNVIFTGIWYQAGTAKMIVDSCKFTNASASGTTPYAILFDSQTDSAILTRNNIVGLMASGSSAVRGFYFRTTVGTSYSLIANNTIALTAANGSSININGILYEGSVATKAEIYNNSILIGGTLNSGGTSGNVISAGILKTHSGTGDEFLIKNNLIVNERSGGNAGVQHVALALSNTSGTFTMNYNTYNASSGTLVRYGTTTYSDIATWQGAAASNETNSNSEPVVFTSSTDLHLSGASLGNMNLVAEPLAEVSVDIDNEQRNATNPYRGADENTFFVLPVRMISFTATPENKNVLLRWKTSNENGNAGFEVQRSFNGAEFSSIGFVAGSLNNVAIKEYSFTDNDVAHSGKVFYRLKQIDHNGRYHYSAICIVSLQLKDQFDVIAYPNPFRDKIQLNISAKEAMKVNIQLYDIFGKLYNSENHLASKGTTSISLPDIANLSKGIYIVKITGEGIVKTIRLVK